MALNKSQVWGLLERCRGTAFLVAGCLFFVSPVAKGLVFFTDTSPQIWLIALMVFSGVTASLVGLLGLYPQLTDRTRRLSLAGVVATVLAGALTIVIFAWMLGAHLLPLVPGMIGIATPPAIVFASLLVSLATAFTSFGIASAWSAIPSRTVGCLLLTLAAPWIALIIANAVFSSLPAWLSLPTYGLIPVVMLVLGHNLRTGTSPTDSDSPSGEAVSA